MAVLIIAVVALRDPKSGSSGTVAQSVTSSSDVSSASLSTTPPTSARPSSSSSTGRSSNASSSGSSSESAGVTGSDATSSASDAAKSVPLVVLNNTTISGLAKRAAARFEAGGWTVTSSGNLTNNILSTCAYYDPDVTGAEAAAKALQAQYPTIKRVEPKFVGLPSGPVVVVLTPDYQSG